MIQRRETVGNQREKHRTRGGEITHKLRRELTHREIREQGKQERL